MSERLGTLLVRARRLKPEQLEEALKRQTEKGGRLGTNLVEIGALDLDLLGAALASQRQIPSASALEFETTPPAVLSLLPAALAAKFVAFPLRVGQGAIVLAMATPWDTDAVRALGDAMHRTVVAKIAPELRILEYLEKRYRLPRPRRMPAPRSPAPEAEAAGPFGQLAQGEFLSSDAEDPFLSAGGSIATSPPLAPRPAAPAPPTMHVPAASPLAQPSLRTPTARPLPGLQPPHATPTPPAVQSASPVPPLPLEPLNIPAGVSLDPFGDSPVAPALTPTPFADPTAPAIAAPPPLDSFLAPAAPQPQEEAALLEGQSVPEIQGTLLDDEVTILPAPEPPSPGPSPQLVASVAGGADPLASLSWDAMSAAPPPPPVPAPAAVAVEPVVAAPPPPAAPEPAAVEPVVVAPPPPTPPEPAAVEPDVAPEDTAPVAEPDELLCWPTAEEIAAVSDLLPPQPAPAPAATEAPPSEPLEMSPPTDYRPVAGLFLVEDALARATRSEKIVESLLWACEGRFEAAAFFVIDGVQARAREGFGPDGPMRFEEDYCVGLDQPSVLHRALEQKAPLVDPAPAAEADSALAARLSLATGGPAAAVPFLAHGSVVGMIWAFCGNFSQRPQLAEELDRLAAMGSRAFARMPLGKARSR